MVAPELIDSDEEGNKLALLKQYIDLTSDESNLTDEELNERLNVFKKLETTRTPIRFDRDAFKKEFKELLQKSSPTTPDDVNEYWSDFVANQTAQNKSLPDFNSIPAVGGYSPNRIFDFYSNNKNYFEQRIQDKRYEVGDSSEYRGDVSRIEQLIGARKFSAQRNSEISDYLSKLPEELRSNRESFLTSERQFANEEFEDFIPQAQQSANVRGALFSGDVEDMLSQRAAELQGGLDLFSTQLEAEDMEFYGNAAYQNQIRKTLESREDYRTALEEERSRVFGEREKRFISAQSELDSVAEERLQRQQYERQLSSQEVRLKRQQDAEDRNRRNQNISSIGRTVGTIGGIAVTGGNPIGGVVGGQISETVASSSAPRAAPKLDLG